MKAVEISKGIYWVGVLDWNLETFHGSTYTTQRGSTYNAYLIIDEKITLVDCVLGDFYNEMLDKIKDVADPAKIDYIITNHVEPDHTSALPALLKKLPKAKVLGTAKCKEGLEKYYNAKLNFQVVKTGEELNIGKRTLRFIEAPMIHWPDSMFTYLVQDQILMPNDAFGQHYATSKRFDDEVDGCVLMDEAAKYYGNILWPFSALIKDKISEIQKMNFPIKMIAPSHGVIWKKEPEKIVNAYLGWASNRTKPKAVILYETMWGSTEKLAKEIAEGVMQGGIETHIFEINHRERTDIIKEMLEAKAFIVGSSTHDNDMLPNIAGFLHFLKGLRPKNRAGFCFGSYGWAGGGAEAVERSLKGTGVDILRAPVTCKFAPTEEELKEAYKSGAEFAARLE